MTEQAVLERPARPGRSASAPDPWWSAPARLILFIIGLAGTAVPRWAELRLGPLLGRLVLVLGAFKVRVARENIRRCFPELSEAARERLLRANYEHYGVLFFEFLHFFSPVAGHYRRYAQRNSRLVGAEHWRKAQARGRGVLFFSAHVGFWEMSAAAAGLYGMTPTIVTKVLKPRWFDAMITACRESTGVTAAYHPGSIPKVLRALRDGGSVAFMNDQYARPPMGIPVRFFGVDVDTLSAVGPLAKRTGAAIVPVCSHRRPDGVVEVVIEPALELGPALESPQAATQALASHVEAWVRKHPEQWLWLHRRFKNVQWPEQARTI